MVASMLSPSRVERACKKVASMLSPPRNLKPAQAERDDTRTMEMPYIYIYIVDRKERAAQPAGEESTLARAVRTRCLTSCQRRVHSAPALPSCARCAVCVSSSGTPSANTRSAHAQSTLLWHTLLTLLPTYCFHIFYMYTMYVYIYIYIYIAIYTTPS
jgi:hypothetical protein